MLLLIAGTASCTKKISGSGNFINQERIIGNFSGIESNGSFDVVILESTTPSLSVFGEDNIISELETIVENGTLKVRFKKNVNVRHSDVTITASTPTLKYLALSGSGTIKPQGRWTLNELTCNLSGSGNITALVNAQVLKANVSGSGSINIHGEAKQSEYGISGSGDIRSFGLEVRLQKFCKDLVIANLLCRKTHAFISGSGRIIYKGTGGIDTGVA